MMRFCAVLHSTSIYNEVHQDKHLSDVVGVRGRRGLGLGGVGWRGRGCRCISQVFLQSWGLCLRSFLQQSVVHVVNDIPCFVDRVKT